MSFSPLSVVDVIMGGLKCLNCRGLGGFNPPSSFFNPLLDLQKYLRRQAKPKEQRSIGKCILLSACIKRFPTRVSFRKIRSSEAMTVLWIIYLFTSVDVAHADVLFLYIYAIYTAMYLRLTVGHARSKA